MPFQTYDSNDPQASVTITGLATTDIEIYKDGSVTQRASDSGYALLDTDGIDFDTTTGIHGVSINLADNTTAGFYAAGSQYWVVIASITVDAATINFIPVTFRIGYPDAIINTTIATLSTQTSFTLTSGPAEDDALNGMWCIIHDVASAAQLGHAIISDYTGSTKTVTLAAGTTFTAAATDNISIMGMAPLQPTTAGATLDVTATGAAGIDWGNVENASTAVDLSGTDIQLCDTITTYTGNTVQTGDAYARLGPPVGASVSADIATVDANVDAVLDDTGTSGVLLAATATSAQLVDDVWDEDIVAAHTTADTAGRALRISGLILAETTLTGAPSTTTMQLTAGSATDDYYNDLQLVFIDGNCAGQARIITDYTGATKTITFDEATINTPSSGDAVIIRAFHNHTQTQISDAVWDEATSGHSTAGSTGKALTDTLADTNELQGDWANGGRLDLIIDELTTQGDTNETKIDTIDTNVDAILVDTGTTIPATLGTPAGADMSTDIAAVKTDTAAILVDTGTTLPATLGTPTDTDLATDIANVQAVIPTDRIAVDVSFTGTGTTTTCTLNQVDGAAASSTDDQYNGRVLIFNAGTLDKVATDITDYNGTTKVATVTAVPVAITSSHTAIMV